MGHKGDTLRQSLEVDTVVQHFGLAQYSACASTLQNHPAFEWCQVFELPMMSTGHLESVQFTGPMTSTLLLKFVLEIASKYPLPVTLVVDNASVHRSKQISQAMARAELQGVTLHFLPHYNPELNRIEKLRQQMKYVWMAVKCRTINTLNEDVSRIWITSVGNLNWFLKVSNFYY